MSVLRLAPLDAPLGSIVQGMDLAKPLSATTSEALRSALATHLLLVFHGQAITPAQLTVLATSFGEPAPHRFVAGLEGYDLITEIRKEPEHRHNYGGTWHTDLSFEPSPPSATVLAAKELPATGGDTLWSNQYLAYDTLPPHLRERVDGLSAEHTSHLAFGGMSKGAISTMHPLAPVHPRTGRRYMYANPVSVARLLGSDGEQKDSAALMAFLVAHVTQPGLQYRHRWAVGDIVVWDNLATMHLAMNDYPGRRRVMHRIAVMPSPAQSR